MTRTPRGVLVMGSMLAMPVLPGVILSPDGIGTKNLDGKGDPSLRPSTCSGLRSRVTSGLYWVTERRLRIENAMAAGRERMMEVHPRGESRA